MDNHKHPCCEKEAKTEAFVRSVHGQAMDPVVKMYFDLLHERIAALENSLTHETRKMQNEAREEI